MSKTNEALKAAYANGLYAKNGQVYGIRGIRKISIKTTHNYSREIVNVGFKGITIPISVHKIIAYQKYGNDLFKEGILVRHLDGNSLNNVIDNIAIGTASDNMMDIPREERLRHGQLAASYLRKYDETTELSICKSYKKGLGYKRLSKKYSIPKSTIRYILFRRKCLKAYNPSWMG